MNGIIQQQGLWSDFVSRSTWVSIEHLQLHSVCCDGPQPAEGQGQSRSRKVWLSPVVRPLGLSSFWRITWNHNRRSSCAFNPHGAKVLEKPLSECRNGLCSCMLQWLTSVHSQCIWKYISKSVGKCTLLGQLPKNKTSLGGLPRVMRK